VARELDRLAEGSALLVSAGRRVVVLDPKGFGESDKPAGGYDLDTAARDLHGFLEATNLATAGGIDIIAHDVGTWIAHAHAANYPADVRRLVLTESNIPGVTGIRIGRNSERDRESEELAICVQPADDLPEILVQGHEQAYLASIFATKSFRSYAIDSAALEKYTRQYSRPALCALVSPGTGQTSMRRAWRRRRRARPSD